VYLDFRGEKWSFKSVQHKADFLDALVARQEDSIEKELAAKKREGGDGFLKLELYHEKGYFRLFRDILCEKGARLCD
jgi:hypothetical protein